MKIKYQISQKTQIYQQVLFQRIYFELEKREYIIINADANCIEFRNKLWLLKSRNEYFGRIDGGRFQFNLNDESVVDFFFYTSLWPEFLLCVFCIVLSLIQDYRILFFIIPVLIMGIFRNISVKSTGSAIIQYITNSNNGSDSI